MIIQLERSGGFAGIPIHTQIDTEELELADREKLEKLVDESGFFELPAKVQSSGQGADRFQYTLTIRKGGQSHTVTAGEDEFPQPLQNLIQQVTTLARRSRGR